MVNARACVCRNEDVRCNKISFGRKTMNFFFFFLIRITLHLAGFLEMKWYKFLILSFNSA